MAKSVVTSKPSAKKSPAKDSTAKEASEKKPEIVDITAEDGKHVEPPPPEVVEPDPELSPEEAEQVRKSYLLTRFWISARGYWGRNEGRKVSPGTPMEPYDFPRVTGPWPKQSSSQNRP